MRVVNRTDLSNDDVRAGAREVQQTRGVGLGFNVVESSVSATFQQPTDQHTPGCTALYSTV